VNIILIIADTLRYDYVGANGNRWIETPAMDRLAKRSWIFDQCYAASYPTLPHRTDVLTGRYGGPFHPWKPLRYDVPIFPRLLAGAGYCTQLIHDTPHMANGGANFDWPFQGWTFVRGAEADRPCAGAITSLPENWARDPVFDFVDDELLYNGPVQNYARANRQRRQAGDRNTARVFQSACDWLHENGSTQLFLLWIDSFAPHEPWDAPPEFVRKYDHTPGFDGCFDPRSHVGRNEPGRTPEAGARVGAFYAGLVSWMDYWLGKLLDTLDDLGRWDDTVVIVTSDHGTNLGERGRYGKDWPPREAEAHVPLLLHVPGDAAGRCNALVQPQDISATILALADVAQPNDWGGQDLAATARAGDAGRREVVLCGDSARPDWGGGDRDALFFVSDGAWRLDFTLRAEDTRLRQAGGNRTNQAADKPEKVRDLRRAAINELARRGLDELLLEYLRREGEAPLPPTCRFWDGWPGPAGFDVYFSAQYLDVRDFSGLLRRRS